MNQPNRFQAFDLLATPVAVIEGEGRFAICGARAKTSFPNRRVAAGDLTTRVRSVSRDETRVLSRAFNVMLDRVQFLLAENAEKAVLEAELATVRARAG